MTDLIVRTVSTNAILTDVSPKNVFNLFLCVFASDQQLIVTVHGPTATEGKTLPIIHLKINK
jgi:hypothetical protein